MRGHVSSSTDTSNATAAERAALIHREILQLGVLIAIGIAGFLLTRAVAASNRAMNISDAAEWYQRGALALQAGQVDDAIDAFRRARVRNRTNSQYGLALARALALHQEDDPASAVLMGLHESSPDDPEINLELGRLAAHRQDVQAALRFYQNALYAPWPPERVDTRRSVRFELIRFLLAQGQTDRATAELLAVSTDLPDKAETHLQVAQLFAEAGDNRHAFDHFQHAVRLDPDNGAALAGAGRVAYQLGRLLAARSYLRRAPADLDDVAETREIVELAISHDPLANRIGAAERRRRLSANVGYERQRLEGCLAQHGPAVRDRASDEKAGASGRGPSA